ncbi:MAG: acetoacetate--CoA ligase, partial [Solirubrobacterales bacterium]|nr:acetoacetate--CoA ligase [Solirubrobacterales bacterium]
MAVGAEVLWSPSEERIERATLTRYAGWLSDTRGLRFDGYHDLWQWSVDGIEAFWESIAEFCEVRFETPARSVLGRSEMPGAEWFPGARLSYPEHIFRGRDPEAVALRHASEVRELGEWTWGRLREETAAIASGLR